MRDNAFIDEPLRVHIFETIKYRDELVLAITALEWIAAEVHGAAAS